LSDNLDELYEIIRRLWLAGSTDREIGQEIARSERWVRGRRYHLQLVQENYPDRRSINGRNTYTVEQDRDILRRRRAGESIPSIARRYGVATRTMELKIERLEVHEYRLDHKTTRRSCLSCGKDFVSRQPRSINRVCPTCKEGA
jgi:hypothetical protein